MSTRKTTLFYALLIAVSSLAVGMVIASRLELTPASEAQNLSIPPTNSAPVTGAIDAQTFRNVAKAQQPMVVNIRTESEQKGQDLSEFFGGPGGGGQAPDDLFRRFFGQPPDEPEQPGDNAPRRNRRPRERTAVAAGTGFIISKDGLILTNNHVIDGATKIEVSLFGEEDDQTYPAKLIGRDALTDTALIQLTQMPNHPVPEAKFGDSAQMAAGDWVMAIGNPFNQGWTVTVGVVSAMQRPFTTDGRTNEMIQTDAAINPGNSGGPLVNSRGEVIGINSAIASGTGYYSGYGFAIPITLAKQVMDDIIEHGRVRRAVIGVSIEAVSPEDAQVAGLKEITGVKVGGYSGDNSPAKAAGLEPGDIIISADGKPADRVSTLQRIIRSHAPGETVTVDVMRYGQKKTFRVKLIEAEPETAVAARERDDDRTAPTGGVSYDKIGVRVENVTAEFARTNRISEANRGVRVTEVDANGVARGKLYPNDIITAVLNPRKDIRAVEDLQSVLSRAKDGEIVSLLVFNTDAQQSSTRVVNLRIGDR